MLISLVSSLAEIWLWATAVSLVLLTGLVVVQGLSRRVLALVRRQAAPAPAQAVRVPEPRSTVARTPELIAS